MVDECLRHFEGLEPWDELTPAVVELRGGFQPPRGL